MKKSLVIILTVLLTVSMSVTATFAYEADEIIVKPNDEKALVNGDETNLDVPAKIVNSRIMVPIRFIAETFGIPILWDGDSRTVTIGADSDLILEIGAYSATVHGKKVALDSPPIIENGRTLVPLRFISEALNSNVWWDSEEGAAEITYSEQLNTAKELYTKPVEGEQEVMAVLDDKFGYDFAVKLAGFGSAKDGRGFHLVGTKAGKDAADYVFNTMKQIGLSPEYQSFDCVGWTYLASDIKVHGHENLKYKITSYPYSVATAKEGLTGELVYVGYASKDELEGLDLEGKIALVDFDWDYNLWPVNFTHQLKNHGVSGVIYYTTNPYGTDPSGDGEFVGCWAGTEQDIPVWTLPLKEGKELAALAQKEKLTITATSDCEIDRNAKGYNVMATIKGAKYPDEYIVINSHFDAYFHCFQDDTISVGLMLAMAKAMVDSGYKPDHSIVFVATDGEESGLLNTAYDWLLGSWALVNEKVKEWDGKIVNAHTLELLGDAPSQNTGFRVSDPMYLFTKALADGFNAEGSLSNDIVVDNYMSTVSDEWSFAYMGHATTRTKREEKADEVYHSSLDTNGERFSYDYYVDYLKSHTSLILRIDKQASAPYDLSRWAQKYKEELNSSQLEAQGLSYSNLAEALDAYTTAAIELLDRNLLIESKYREAKAEGKDTKSIDKLLSDYNKDMRQVVKTVSQGVYYIALEDIASQVAFYQYQPEVYQEAIAYLKAGDGEGMLENFDVDNDDMGAYAQWYSTQFEYETWLDAYQHALVIDDPDYDYTWGTGRVMKYYDFYKILLDVEAKAESGNKDFSAEIKALESIEKDLLARLKKAYSDDLSLWIKAKNQLPIKKADAILDAF